MFKKIIGLFSIITVVFVAQPAAHVPGDLNCNGFVDVADLIVFVNALHYPCDFQFGSECVRRNSDVDLDGRSMTIADVVFIPWMLVYGYGSPPPEFPRHPELDTIMVESTIASPGETIALPLWVKTVDTLVAFQFLLEVDPDYIEFDTVIVYDDFPMRQNNCDGNIYCNSMADIIKSPVLLLPGNHHIADIIVTINPGNDEPATTSLTFSSFPSQALYSGFANSTFFLPVMVDAEIQIIPVTDIESETETIPTNFEISVYPNPFNDAVNISVFSDRATEISVYDIVGRPVKTFAVNAGNNLVKWDATDINGQSISAGIYFIGESGNKNHIFKKVLYLK